MNKLDKIKKVIDTHLPKENYRSIALDISHIINDSFELTKPVKTRDGRAARIICVDRDHDEYPIVALVQDKTNGGNLTDGEVVQYFTATGRAFMAGPIVTGDLINL